MPKSEPVSVCDSIKNSTVAVHKFSMATASLQCVVVIFCSNWVSLEREKKLIILSMIPILLTFLLDFTKRSLDWTSSS